MAEWRSQYCTTDNQYILFRIWVRETATNVINNTSTLRITVYAWRTNEYTTNYSGGCNVKIDGTARGYQYWSWGECPVYYDSDTVLYDEEGIVISHNSDGTKTINVAATCEWYADGSIYIDSAWQSFNVTLTALDRSAPTVSVSTSNIGVNSFTISASSNVNCDRWDRSIDNGSTWTNFSTTNGTSASTTVTGLSPNTTYNVKVRARKTSNQVYGTSATTSPKTIGNSILNSVSTVTADNSTVSFTINTTVYVPSYTHKLEIKNGNTSILTKTGLTLSSGNNTITLTSAERTTLLNAMSTIKSFTGTFNLSTWSGSTQIGSTTSKTATVQTTSANSAPTFSSFTYSDTNTTTTGITGNNQILIQGYSTLQVVASAATAKNGATIKSYSVSAGSATASSTSTTINVGTVSNTGTVTVTVSAVDSRGYSTSRSVNVTVLAYTKIKFTSSTIRRVNEVENTIQLSFAGTITSLSVGGTDKNALQACQYRYKKTSDSSYGSYTNITSSVTRSGNNLSYSNASLVNLDANYSWHVQVYLQDKLTTDTITLTISQGTPTVSFRNKKVGINVLNPTEALDVNGNIKVNEGQITIQKSCAASNTYGDTNPKLIFKDVDGSQNISLTYTDADAVQAPASLTLNGNQGGEYFIAPYIKSPNGTLMGSVFVCSGSAFSPSGGKDPSLSSGTSRLYKNSLVISNPATANDQGWIRVTGSAESDTILEIATGDDGGSGEAIVARQYNTSNNVARQATLLGTDGHTRFPGYVFCNYLNISCGNDNGATSSSYALYANSDNYLRKCSMSKMHSALGGSGCVQLYSGSLGSGAQTTFNYGSYSMYIVICQTCSDAYYFPMPVPKGFIPTSNSLNFTITDETRWMAIRMWYSGSTCYLNNYTGNNDSRKVIRVYGIY